MQTYVSENTVLAALKDEAVLLTASSSLAADWRHRAAAAAQGQVCETPPVFSWTTWMRVLSQQLQTKICLTKLQEQQLWEQVIRKDLQEEKARLPASLRGLAQHASKAYALMQEYRIGSHELALGGEESEALARWIAAIQKRLKNGTLRQRVLEADIAAQVCSMVADMALPKRIMLDGFKSLTPMQQHILNTVEQAGCACLQVKIEQEAATPVLTACPDEVAEHRHVAARIHALLNENPRARIAILASESTSNTSVLRRALDESLVPESCIDPTSDVQAVAMPGAPLSGLPMVQQILHLLSIAGQTHIRFDDFSALLFSPWLKGFEAERMDRARLDAIFREQNRHRLSWKGLLKSSAVQGLPLLSSAFKVLAEWNTGSRPANGWVKAVHGLLKTTGFVQTGSGDEAQRSNMEIRQMNGFRDILTSLAAADAVSSNMPWVQFFSMLRSACADHRLALTPKYPNVVVMPLNQVPGLRLDHVLVLGMDEEAFPPPTRPHPMLPLSLQQEYSLPMSTASHVFESSCWLWKQLLRAAPVVEISFARQKNERELLPSSFVVGLEELHFSEIKTNRQHMELETFADAPDVPVQDDETIRGGTAIIKDQSACPFRAFATHRLGIAELDETAPGIEPFTKGLLIHLALEFIWDRLGSQQALLALDEVEYAELIDVSIAHAWEKNRTFPDSHIKVLEKKRMHRVLSEWLEIEAERPAFQVLKTEEKYDLKLPSNGGKKFSMRIKADRLDKDATGHCILLDYKTGAKQSVTKWQGARMEEPQLPLYALAAELSADDAVAFASVRSGKDMGFEGLAAEDIGIPGLTVCDGKRGRPDDWQQVLDDWKLHINALASEFVAGYCDVSPRDASACKYCSLKSVCRVEETGFDINTENSGYGEAS